MNNITTAFSPIPSTTSSLEFVNQFAYIIILSIGVLVVILTTTLACYLFRSFLISTLNSSQLSRQIASPISSSTTAAAAAVAPGLDEAVLRTYPKMPYSQAKQRYGIETESASCCSICLAEYKDDHMILSLPDCDHFFHFNCVSQWFRARRTCPVCRNSPV